MKPLRKGRTEESQRRRDRRRARGLCIDCPQPSERYMRCLTCRAKSRQARAGIAKAA
jgi:hypothetical protein